VVFILSSGALAKRVQRKDPEVGEHRAPKEQQQSTGLRLDDGPNDAVVFRRSSDRGLHLGHRRATRRYCHSPPVDCLEFQTPRTSYYYYLYYLYYYYFNDD